MDNNHVIELLRCFSRHGGLVRLPDAQDALLPFGDEVVPAMIEALADPDADLRIFALKIIEDCEGDTEPALPVMIKALDDADRIVRIAAVGPVAAFGEKAMDAVPILEKWIGTEDEFSHVTAIGHILMIDPSRAGELLPSLSEFLESGDYGIRCQAAWLLGQLGELAR